MESTPKAHKLVHRMRDIKCRTYKPHQIKAQQLAECKHLPCPNKCVPDHFWTESDLATHIKDTGCDKPFTCLECGNRRYHKDEHNCMQEKAQEIAELSDRVKHIERVNRLLEEMMEEKDEAMIELDGKIEKLAADVGFMVHE